MSISAYNTYNPVQITTTSSGSNILSRPETRDVFVEIPTNTPKCGYNTACKNIGLIKVPVVLTNSHATEERTVRLSFSRNFETRDVSFAPSSQKRPGAEITGLVGQLFDTTKNIPSGIPCHISKNWHDAAGFWAGFQGYWWTVNCFMRIPADSTISLSLVVNYETYGGIAAFSHSQLSIVGYSDKWLWEEAALGSGGENICFDPLGTHTRASITDVRPKIFDGKWKENVGGGDFVWLWGENGELQYPKELDPQLRSNGPCLTNASYHSVTLDNELDVSVEVSGGRTDDMVRVFFQIKIKVLKNVPKFTRLVFFQFGSETYNYRANFDKFVIGSSGGASNEHTKTEHSKTCDSNTNPAGTGKSYTKKNKDKMYESYTVNDDLFRKDMSGKAPWWISYGANADTVAMPDNDMVVGDRGLIVREYDAKINGVKRTAPTFSILCDKIELSTPAGVLELKQDDYIYMKLELLILPRQGTEFNAAVTNTNSPTLQSLQSLSTSWERIKKQAEGNDLTVTSLLPLRSIVESHYPIRVCRGNGGVTRTRTVGDTGILFTVTSVSGALGYVPVTLCNLDSYDIPLLNQRGLWVDKGSDGGFVLMNQETAAGTNDFYQVNYDRNSQKYEVVYNLELFDTTTTIAFGSDPSLWPNPTCTGFSSCVGGTTHLKTLPGDVTCATATCQTSECCTANPTCTGFSSCVGGTTHLKTLPGDVTCATATCQTSECCTANPTCTGFSSCSSTHQLKTLPGDVTCATATCVSNECCDLKIVAPSPTTKTVNPEDSKSTPSSRLNATNMENKGGRLVPDGIIRVVIGLVIMAVVVYW